MSRGLMLFHRDFQGYTGGHGKVWDYFNHAIALGWDARVHLAPGSLRDTHNPWMSMPGRIEPAWRPERAAVLFLAGMDWLALPPGTPVAAPVVNLVQHVRHADPGLPWRAFLARPATRVCVSEAVAGAIQATGEVNGPVHVIPAALDLPAGVGAGNERAEEVFIGALKDPALGQALAAALEAQGHRVCLATQWMPRQDYLQALARCAVAVPLPHPAEGFFLPGLEAMALGTPVVMPACGGSRQYARPGLNCLMPAPTVDALAAAVGELLHSPQLRAELVAEGQRTAAGHGRAGERAAFARVLEEVAP